MANDNGKGYVRRDSSGRFVKKSGAKVSSRTLVSAKSKADRLFEKAAKETYSKRNKRVG